jgi:epoxyqueuosine reductase
VDLKGKIQEKALELGFSLVGVTPADPLQGAEFYARWVALGYAGEMEYLTRYLDKRAAPKEAFIPPRL